MDRKGFYIFCDESLKQGKHYSNFYGGCMVPIHEHHQISELLNRTKVELGMEDSELKWSLINNFRVNDYCKMMDVFFDLVANDRIKMRVMFTDNRRVPKSISKEKRQIEYHLLYYQFIKHAFGFRYLESDYDINLEVFFDTLPDTVEKNRNFKKFIYGLQFHPDLLSTRLLIAKDAIYEVDSKDHILLQCTDVVLGAMAFRLNDHHKEKPKGARSRGKRTIAKEKVYKHIAKRIREIKPHFNIGISTGAEQLIQRFTDPYRHWMFIPNDHVYIHGSKNKKRPSTS